MTDLEERLRTMLRERAADVSEVPVRVVTLPAIRPRRSRPVGWLVAAAVAIVVALAAAVAVSGGTRHSAPPVSRPATVHPTPTITSRVPCTAALPAQWKTAATKGSSRYGARSAVPLAVSADGTRLLVTRDFGTNRDVAVVDRHGKARSVYSVPQPDQYQVANASMDGNYAALDVDRVPRNSNGVLPSIRWLVLVDLRSGTSRVLDSTSLHDQLTGGRTLDRSELFDGVVYWDVRARFATPRSVIKGFQVTSGRTEVVGQGSMDPRGPELVANGVQWDRSRPDGGLLRSLPGDVPRSASLRTDGSSYAWALGANGIAWWRPGQEKPTVVHVPGGSVSVETVAGAFVFFDGDHTPVQGTGVLDARTGAVAMLPEFTPLTAAGGTAVGYRFAGGSNQPLMQAVRLDTSSLPELRC